MKKLILIIVPILIVTLALLSGCKTQQSAPAATQAPATQAAETKAAAPAATTAPAAEDGAPITESQAKGAAITNAGFYSSEVTFTEVNLETENGKQIYEVEFIAEGNEYKYEIDAMNGAILKTDVEPVDD